jgi:hypothetical protein
MSELPLRISEHAAVPRPSGRGPILILHTLRAACRLIHVACAALALALPFGLPAAGQIAMGPGTQQYPGQMSHSNSTADLSVPEQDAFRARKMVAALNAQRQKSMVSDSNKLLRLAMELNVELSRGDSGLSPSEQMRKVAEIEKLARNVKDKMAYTMGSSPEPETSVVVFQH